MEEEVSVELLPSRTYKIFNGRISGWIDELSAMKQAIEKVLSTERLAWEIYTDNYGVELENLIGEDFDLAVSEIERVVTEALTADDRIIELDNFDIKQEGRESLLVSFLVHTVFGDISINQEVVI